MTGEQDAVPTLEIVAAVNNDQILSHNLMRSPLIAGGKASLRCYRGFSSAGAAYNRGLDETTAKIVVFAHQDVYLPAGWEQALARAIATIETHDPHWAVIGAFGIDTAQRHVGHVWSSGLGRRLGGRFDLPVEALCIDELLIVLRRASGLRFDAALPGFHLYGTDVVLAARAAGQRAYVADIPAIHNSRPVPGLKADYVRAYRYMQRKWNASLPVPTLIAPLQRSAWPLLTARFRAWRTRHVRMKNAVHPGMDPEQLVMKLDVG